MDVKRLLVLSALLMAPGGGLEAQVPLTAGELPRYPGVEEKERETVEPWQDESGYGDRVILGGARVTLEVAASPEEVFRWYHARLGGTRVDPDEGIYPPEEWPEPGTASEVQYDVSGHDLEREGDRMVMSGAELRKRAEQSGRKPLEPGLWVQHASFAWRGTSAEGESTEFRVDISDGTLGMPTFDPTAHLTVVTVSWESGYAGDRGIDHIEATGEAEMAESVAARLAEMGSAGPTEAELGLPLYPGARFDAQMSAGLSMGDGERYYIYLSQDPIEKVVAFYEGRTGKTAQKLDDNSYMLAVRGTLPFPELGVIMQAELALLPDVPTVISIRKEL